MLIDFFVDNVYTLKAWVVNKRGVEGREVAAAACFELIPTVVADGCAAAFVGVLGRQMARRQGRFRLRRVKVRDVDSIRCTQMSSTSYKMNNNNKNNDAVLLRLRSA